MCFFYKWVLSRRIRLRLKSANRRREFCNFRKADTILVLFDVEDGDGILDFIGMLKVARKEVSAVAFGSGNGATGCCTDAGFVFIDENMGYLSKTVEAVEVMLGKSVFDLVLDMTKHGSLLRRYVLVLANASLRVGISGRGGCVHDLLVLAPAGGELSVGELGRQMVSYLSMIS
ncbi:MAG: hypothetical protein LBF79_00360 [Dysgonamonadaceae bacterium]|jgi:hypothetical protein|nr:hypothetical protein [Dysgonamonadaceae bacterium]